ncbi:MAG: hypothetical protein ACXWU9_11885 [Telluria sp.]
MTQAELEAIIATVRKAVDACATFRQAANAAKGLSKTSPERSAAKTALRTLCGLAQECNVPTLNRTMTEIETDLDKLVAKLEWDLSSLRSKVCYRGPSL